MDNHTQPKESLIEADVQQSTLESPCYKPRAIILITQVLLVSFTLAACASSASASILQSKKARQEPVVAQDDLNALVSGNNTFAFDLYPAMSNGEDNMIYSPYSLSQVLAMVYAGASGQTA